jgi:uncharacterized 2Fe-2S/4Fe-4S cluster protein (DUF4445 family)
VKFLPEGKMIQGKGGESLLGLARRGGVDFLGPCAGKALCAKCLVKVLTGSESLSSVSDDESSVLTHVEVSDGYRLGCRCMIEGEGKISVFTPNESRLGTYVLLSEGLASSKAFDPAVSILRIQPYRLTADTKEGSLGFFVDGESRTATPRARRSLSRVAGGPYREVSLVQRVQEVLDVRENCRLLGFAVDVGTTKVAGHLVDLEDGKTIYTVADINPQIAHGEDVISRLQYAVEGGQDQLHEEVVNCVNALLAKACEGANVSPEDVYEVVAVGNSAMHHLLFRFDPRKLAYAPYVPANTAPLDLDAKDVGLQANPAAKVFVPPLVAGFVGTDVVADIVATDMHNGQGSSILVDIGTNTEIVVKAKERLLTCSTASGPAFEGAHVDFGMRAATGAIDSVEISGGSTHYTVIGGKRPRGITGSAVVDAMAELFRVGLLDKSGRLAASDGSGRVRLGERGYREFVIADKSETFSGVDLTLGQRDIREIQLAKAATRAGLNILMGEAGVGVGDVKALYIAGAFGFFLNPVSAEAIGLYPKIDVNRIRLVGNTALAGARALLLSQSTRTAAGKMVKAMEYVELATHSDFRREFMKSIVIPYDDGTLAGRPR